jgi:hypothetical protein
MKKEKEKRKEKKFLAADKYAHMKKPSKLMKITTQTMTNNNRRK